MSPKAVTHRWRRRVHVTAVVVLALISALATSGLTASAGGLPHASADSALATSAATITHIESITDRRVRVFIDSPAMQGEVQVQVLLPRDVSASRPTLYMLDGRSAEPGANNWIQKGEAVEFFEDKPVNVVMTVGGRASYYTDWQRDDPALGQMKWETFLTQELPPLIDARFNGNGTQSIAGLSMGGQAAIILAFRNPELYSGVASYSGCYETDSPLGFAQMGVVVDSFGGNVSNMWGPLGDADWAAHDVFRHAGQLRDTDIYVSAATGLPGPNETLDNPDLVELVVVGGTLEAISHQCTRMLEERLVSLAIPATFVYNDVGVHHWPYWPRELHASWPTLSRSLGV